MRTARCMALLMGIGFLPACYDSTPTSYDNASPDDAVPLEVARSGSTITDYVLLMQWGTYGSGPGQFNIPTGVGIDSNGNVYVVDRGNHRIQKFDSDGVFLSEWGTAGTGDGQFDIPNGIDIDEFDHVYVSERTPPRVQKFDTDGLFITKWGRWGFNAIDEFIWLTDVSVADGFVYVVDRNQRQPFGRVKKFLSDGTPVAQWDNNLQWSGGIEATDSYVYTTGPYGGQFRRYDTVGQNGIWIGSQGTGPGQFDWPSGVAVDADGYVYVAEGISGRRVQKLDADGNFITAFGHNRFPRSSHIAVDPSGRSVYVADWEGNRILKFGPSNSPPDLLSVTGPPAPVLLGTEVTVVGTFTDPDAGDTHTAAVDWGDMNVTATAVDEGAGTATGLHTYEAPGVYKVTMTVTDSYDESDTEVFEFVVVYVAPDLDALTGPVGPVPVNDEVTVVGTYTDLDVGDTHTALVDWGDMAVTVADVDPGAGTATGMHSYDTPGVYPVTMTLIDSFGASDTEVFEFVVVYDTDGGFVTGGGWFDSPEGAFAADPALTGKANIGFVAKYKKGATVPTGNTEFQFNAGELNFHSASYEWLVVNQGGTRAQFKGEGTINGGGVYKFMIWADDDDPDTFRIRITEVGGGLVYDNGVDQPIGGGSIKVHTKK